MIDPKLAAFLAAAHGVGVPFDLLRGKPKKAYKTRTCIVCGKEFTNNKAFCSAECCRKYKEQSR